MKIHFCDVCDLAIKDGEKSFLILVCEADFNKNLYGRGSLENIKEICPTCRKIIEDLFALRLAGVAKLTKQIKDSFNTKFRAKIKKRKNK